MNSERDRLKNLLIILLEEISLSPDKRDRQTHAIHEKVVAAGLDEADVNGLLDWIESHWHPEGLGSWSREYLPDAPSYGAFRVFGDPENEYLTPGALGFLIELLNDGQINRMQMEALMQYASFIAIRPLERGDLEPVIEQVLFRPHKPGLTGGASEGWDSKH